MIKANIAIVGRPNVGKSTLFNRIIGKRQAIVLDTPGVTRDRNYGVADWNGKKFNIIDTGGMNFQKGDFNSEINSQVESALADADLIIFLTDSKSGITDLDAQIGKLLRPRKKDVILAVNKADNDMYRLNAYDFYNLGLGDPIAISANHGTGVGDLLDLVTKKLPDQEDPSENDHDQINVSIIGEPNVGKSSLVNRLIGDERLIVSSEAGTTRDAISLDLKTEDGEKFKLIDTAGIRRSGKVQEAVEKFSVIRAKNAVEDSDVSLVLIDAKAGIREQDKRVAGIAFESGRSIIIVVNKWDLIEKDDHTMKEFEQYVRDEFPYLSFAPIVFISAQTGLRVSSILPLVSEVYANSIKRIPSAVLNDVLFDAISMTPPAAHKGKILKLFYLTQVEVKPPLFIVFVNDLKLFHFSYERYLINYLRKVFDFTGVPVKIKARERS
ncbi:ribosome biogenesis GTPase Der [Xylocopilactobacillus apicola]|uniref:ribosome biogenesis GTPase Der n=1 Tax=Xylocopilactobacillus apicola TaxID=2932184 RepID=UPI0029531A54|nr:ribosome biogenesis GTPase Der [Xylocopilactobacillus apicola]